MKLGSLLIRVFGATTLVLVAASSTALAYPKSCNDVWLQSLGSPPADGDYVIEPTPGVVFTVYCKDVALLPKEYLTLQNTGGDFNFSQITAGGAQPGTNVRTTFTKIRIDPKTLLVDIGDLTFATSTGAVTQGGGTYTSVSYGVAADCQGSGSSTGIANIDLTGTPFQVSSVFASEGWYPAGTVNGVALAPNSLSVTVSGKVVNLTGGGYCGGTGPDGFNSSYNFWVYEPGMTKLALQLQYVGQ